jgi:hypothetical protein
MKGSRKETLAGVKNEMAKPRVAKSARKGYANLGSPAELTKAGKRLGRQRVKRRFEGEI